jgi:hypothetical protein
MREHGAVEDSARKIIVYVTCFVKDNSYLEGYL